MDIYSYLRGTGPKPEKEGVYRIVENNKATRMILGKGTQKQEARRLKKGKLKGQFRLTGLGSVSKYKGLRKVMEDEDVPLSKVQSIIQLILQGKFVELVDQDKGSRAVMLFAIARTISEGLRIPLGFLVGSELLHKISGSSSGNLHEVLNEIEQVPGSGMGGSYAGGQIQTVLDALDALPEEKKSSPEERGKFILENKDLLLDLEPERLESLHHFAITARLREIRKQREAEGKKDEELNIGPAEREKINAEELEKVRTAAETPIGVMRSTVDFLIDAMLRNGLYAEPGKGELILDRFVGELIKLLEMRGLLTEADANELRTEMGILGGGA
jgi:hypothetical protein